VIRRFAIRALKPLSLGLMVLALASCGGGSDSRSTVLEGKEGRPDVSVPEGEPGSKLEVVALEKGSGRPARDGDELSVRYFSFAYEGHRIYEDHWRQLPLRFVFGSGQAADAWEAGLSGIRAGERRELIVPGGTATPNNAPEIYVVEAVSVEPGNPAEGQAGASPRKVKGTGPRPKLRYPPRPPRHVVVRILKEGSAGPRIKPGENLAVRYLAGNPKTKFVQDFWSEEDPYRFRLGQNHLGRAWEIGLKGMRLGGRRELIVPSRLAYDNGMMVYVIELLEMEERKPRRRG